MYITCIGLALSYSIYKGGNKVYDVNKWGSFWCHYTNYINMMFAIYIFFK